MTSQSRTIQHHRLPEMLTASSPRRFFGLSVCIGDSERLLLSARNAIHFESWIVITVPGDARTREVCARLGAQCFLATSLQADGSDYDASIKKGVVINEALDAISLHSQPSPWIVLFEAGMLLPRHFRQRLEAQPLQIGHLYSAFAAAVCKDSCAFSLLKEVEPWPSPFSAKRSGRAARVFHLAGHPSRFPSSLEADFHLNDDARFADGFPAELQHVLPFTALEAPPIPPAGAPSPSPSSSSSPGFTAALAQLGPGNIAAVTQPFPRAVWEDFFRHFDVIYTSDDLAPPAESHSELARADHQILRQLFDQQVGGRIRPRSFAALSREIAPQSISLLFIVGYVSAREICAQIRFWLPFLKDGAILCGELFGLPQWPHATHCIAALFGVPDTSSHRGFWWQRLFVSQTKMMLPQPTNANAGVVVCVESLPRLEAFAATLYSIRKYWVGPVTVFFRGEIPDALEFLCTRFGTTPCVLEERFQQETWLEEISLASPFTHSCILYPGNVVHSPIPSLLATWDHPAPTEVTTPCLLRKTSTGWETAGVDYRSAAEFDGNGAVIGYHGDSDEWTDLAWEHWCEIEVQIALQSPSRVRSASDTTIIGILTSGDLPAFERNFLTWRFSPGTPIILLAIDFAPTELWVPMEMREHLEIHSPRPSVSGDLSAFLHEIAALCHTRRVTFIPSTAAALPGAEIWPEAEWNDHEIAVHRSHHAAAEYEITGNDFFPQELFVQMTVEKLRAIAASPAALGLGYSALAFFLHRLLPNSAGSFRFMDVSQFGWNLANTYTLVDGKTPPQPVYSIRKAPDSAVFHLADDVVVISLPERVDRRERIAAMLDRERIAFRFVDGVRVSDHDLDPHEVSQVGKQRFKLAGGWQKYLRGMAGCRRAHLQCLEQALQANLDSLLILEDDMHLEAGWLPVFEAAVAELPADWLQLYLSAAPLRAPSPFSPHLRRLVAADQTTAILYSKKGIRAAFNCLRNSRMEIDRWMGLHLHPYGFSYLTEPSIAYQRGGVSDIMSFDRGTTH